MSDDDDSALFRNALKAVKPIASSDKVVLSRQDRLASAKAERRSHISDLIKSERQSNAYFAFSDAFEAHFNSSGPLKYVRDSANSDQLKRLRRGDYVPELILDLHGLTRELAKAEIAALLYAARQRHLACVCIVHGIGTGVLRQQVPNWLVQHPDILAFHQATLEWGGQGAVLVLVNNTDPKLG
jgi:DNA-nicking Smr family endonuclease